MKVKTVQMTYGPSVYGILIERDHDWLSLSES